MATDFFDAVFCAFVAASFFTTKTCAQLPHTRFSTKWFSTKCNFSEGKNFYYKNFFYSVLEVPHFIGEMPTGISKQLLESSKTCQNSCATPSLAKHKSGAGLEIMPPGQLHEMHPGTPRALWDRKYILLVCCTAHENVKTCCNYGKWRWGFSLMCQGIMKGGTQGDPRCIRRMCKQTGALQNYKTTRNSNSLGYSTMIRAS